MELGIRLARGRPDGPAEGGPHRRCVEKTFVVCSVMTPTCRRARRADGALPTIELNAILVPTDRPDVWTVTLSNDGSVDATLPRQVRLDPVCEMADGATCVLSKASIQQGGRAMPPQPNRKQ